MIKITWTPEQERKVLDREYWRQWYELRAKKREIELEEETLP